jgi:hypothetical protein
MQQMLQTKQMEIDGRIKVAEVAAQARIQVEQLQAKEEADHAVAQARLEINQQAFDAQQADLDRKGDLDKIKAELAMMSAKLNLQQDLSLAGHKVDLHKHNNPAITPPTEPAGRAKPGEAYQG